MKRPSDSKKSEQEIHLVNVDAERIVLGKMLENESVFWDLNNILLAEHFSVEIHRDLFTAIYHMATGGKKVTLSLILSRVGPEYGDGASTMTFMTALIRNVADIDDVNQEVRTIIELWQRRRTIEICSNFIKEAKKQGTDAAYMLHDMESCVKDVTTNSQAEPLRSLGEFASSVFKRSAKATETGVSRGFDTGLPSLDEILGLINPGDFGVIGAPRGHGKTILGLQLARRVGEYFREPVAFFELEMQGEDLGTRVLAGETNLSVSEIEEGTYPMFELDQLQAARERLNSSLVFVDDRPKLRIDQVRERCIWLKRTRGLRAAVVDHIRLMQAMGRFKDKFDRIEFVTGEMKAIAKELGIALIALSQVTRLSQRRDDPFPRIDDFDGGPSVEQDSDWALGMFRWDAWMKERKPRNMDGDEGREWLENYAKCKNRIEIKTLKRRRGDGGGSREFEFDGRAGVIREIEK